MVRNHLFEIIDVVKDLVVDPTKYTLEESGLVSEICTSGDELSVAKIRLLAAGEDEEATNLVNLKNKIETELLKISGISEVVVKWRLLSDLSHCPTEIQHLF